MSHDTDQVPLLNFKKGVSDETEIQEEYETTTKDNHFTVRAIIVGLFVGCLLCFSNMYFGLQTGWVTMGSLQSSLLGFGILKLFRSSNFGPVENVLIQTTAVATATMPLAGGFVSVIPAMQMMTSADHVAGSVQLSWWELFVFAFGLAFFGVFAAVPLRTQTILKEKLPFPSGTATAQMIKVLHGVDDHSKITMEREEILLMKGSKENLDSVDNKKMRKKWIILGITFAFSSLYALFGYFIPVLRNIPIHSSLTAYYWVISPSLSYVGQGMIMGTRIGLSMMFGAVFGWVFLAYFVQTNGWAPGSIGSYQNGLTGWLMWFSLAIMIAEALSSLGCVVVMTITRFIRFRHNKKAIETDSDADPAPPDQQVPLTWWGPGLIVSMVMCVLVGWLLFLKYIPVYEPLVAVILALFVAVLGVRALGETDVNPVSGVGKVTQLVFAVVAPGNILSNLVAGAIAEAGAQQAGDMMQDLKTGHLLRASPRAQFYAQMIGSAFSAIFAVGAFLLYTSAWPVPGDVFQVPTAFVWLQMARLVNGGELAPNVLWFAISGGIIAASLPILALRFPNAGKYIPSGIAFAIAIYVTPNWTIPRVVGSLVHFVWQRWWPESHSEFMIIVASGFVLGEGVTSIITAVMKTLGVPAWTCISCFSPVCSCAIL